MATPKRTRLLISQLLLDTENPRFEVLAGQDAALKEMLDKQKTKLVNLAKDIVNNGLSPSDLPIVTPDTKSGHYVVLEGNRRVAALRVLSNPSKINLASDKSVRKSFTELAGVFSINPIDRIDCVVFETRPAADHWIELRHRGENQGVGVVQWDAQATDRFRERKSGEPSPEKQVLEFVRSEGSLSSSQSEKLDKVPLSSLKRLVQDPDVRKKLGITYEDKKVKSTLAKSEILKGLTRVLIDLLEKEITVTKIKLKEDRAAYIDSLSATELPDTSQKAGGIWALDDPDKVTKSPKPKEPKKKTKPQSHVRKRLIPANVKLTIDHNRLNDIYHEMRKLDVDTYTNSSAVMLRVFLELSIDEYAERECVSFKDRATLNQKMTRIADHFENGGILSKNELKAVRKAASSKDELFSTDTLNSYVHNPKIMPIAKEIKITWDNMQRYIEKLHE